MNFPRRLVRPFTRGLLNTDSVEADGDGEAYLKCGFLAVLAGVRPLAIILVFFEERLSSGRSGLIGDVKVWHLELNYL